MLFLIQIFLSNLISALLVFTEILIGIKVETKVPNDHLHPSKYCSGIRPMKMEKTKQFEEKKKILSNSVHPAKWTQHMHIKVWLFDSTFLPDCGEDDMRLALPEALLLRHWPTDRPWGGLTRSAGTTAHFPTSLIRTSCSSSPHYPNITS